MRILSNACVYGLRAALYIVAHRGDRDFVPIREMSDELGISFHFLTKTLQQLTAAGFLTSGRGIRGGVALTLPPEETNLLQLITILEGRKALSGCILGLGGCGDKTPCPLHSSWVIERKRLRNMFEKTSLAALGQGVLRSQLRLSD